MNVDFTTANTTLLGKCKYCKSFSPVNTMMIDENKKPYHQVCEDKKDNPEVATMEERIENV